MLDNTGFGNGSNNEKYLHKISYYILLLIKFKTMAKKATNAKKVPAKSDAAEELKDFFEDGLKDIYWAEKALVKALPKMQRNASSAKLKTAIEQHLKETQGHVKNLEKVFTLIGKKAQAAKCDAMAGLLKEGNDILEETKPGAVRDAGIIAASQKVEHYEIATYGTLATFATQLGHKDAAKLLADNLKQEKNCDTLLSKLAKSEINLKAK